MKLFSAILIALVAFTASLTAEIYHVSEVKFVNNKELTEYFEKYENRSIAFQGVMKEQAENEMSSMSFDMTKKGDVIVMDAIMDGKSRGEMEFYKVKDGVYKTGKMGRKSFYELHFDGDKTTLVSARMIDLNKPKEMNDDYKKIKEKYGEEIRAYVIEMTLSDKVIESEMTGFDVEKTFKITDIEVKYDEEVTDFGKKHVEYFATYYESDEKRLNKHYVDKVFKINIKDKNFSISSDAPKDKYNLSGKIQKVGDGHYRAYVIRTYYDFFLNGGPDEEFNVEKIEYGEFFEISEKYRDKEGYEQLFSKYGERVPYKSMIQYVEEVPNKK